MIRSVVRLSIETLGWINKLGKIYGIEFGGLQLSQGHVISKAYYFLNKSVKDIKEIPWKEVNEASKPKIEGHVNLSEENSTKNNITTLFLSDEAFEGIKYMKEFLPREFDTTRVNIGFCIKLIVKAALIEAEKDYKVE